VVDVQNCFVDGGTLPVKGGAQVVPVINKLAASFENIVVTQDWHTPGHASFASTHAGKKPFETTQMPYGTQVLWPDHCVQGSDDAALLKDLKLPTAQLIVRKGFHKDVDSYSAFEEADRKTATGLGAYLKARGIDTVFVTGLATDFCVAWTAMDARKLGFNVYVIEDATRGIDLNGSLAAAWKQMTDAGVKRIQSGDIA
jgi:nicotinamidase/pyrazinamidase